MTGLVGLFTLQAAGFVRVESGLIQAVFSLVGLAADHVIRYRYKSDAEGKDAKH